MNAQSLAGEAELLYCRCNIEARYCHSLMLAEFEGTAVQGPAGLSGSR
jgi:hypothetical protein